MGEGVGIVVFELLDLVKERGVEIYVEVVGYGFFGDVYYIIVFVFEGEGGLRVM